MGFGKMKLSGFVQHVGQEQTFPSGFSKRTLVIVDEQDGKYKNYAVFDFFKDDCALLDGLAEGEAVDVEFFPAGNESKREPGRWFCGLRGVSVVKTGGSGTQTGAAAVPAASPSPASASDDDLPF